MNWAVLIGVIAGATYLLRLSGPLIGKRLAVTGAPARLLEIAPVVLLVGLAAVSALGEEGDAGITISPARLAGIALGVTLAWRGHDLARVVLATAILTAVLRLF